MDWLGQRLQGLLKERKLSIQRVASDLSIERAYLSQVVHGHRTPSEELVRRLAQYFGEDEEQWAFEVRAHPIVEEIRTRYPRQMLRYARTIQDADKEKPDYRLGQSVYGAYFTPDQAPSPSRSEFLSTERIECFAAEALSVFASRLGTAVSFPIDAELLVQEVFGLQVHYDGEGLLDELDESLLGCLFPDGSPSPLGTDRIILVNQAPRYKSVTPEFTILHEAGHYVFHYPRDAGAPSHGAAYCRNDQVGEAGRVKVPPREWQASRFASEVLMPKERVRWLLDGKAPAEVINLDIYGPNFRQFFGVSQHAMEHRLFMLGYQLAFGRYGYANRTTTPPSRRS